MMREPRPVTLWAGNQLRQAQVVMRTPLALASM
jgi:hypothetical protein